MGIETTLPGDLAAMDTIGMGEGEPIWDRMSKIIRMRRLDVRQLMAGSVAETWLPLAPVEGNLDVQGQLCLRWSVELSYAAGMSWKVRAFCNLFLQLAQARFNALAASTGCMPPVGNGLLRQSLTRQALAVSPVSPVVDFPQRRPAPQCMSGPTTRFIIVSLARSGTTWLESMLKQHPDVHTWSEVVREMAGDGVHADRNVAWRTLRELAYMPPGGAPGRLNGTQLSRAKRVQGLKWFNLEGGLDLQFYPPRDTTERLGSFLRQNRFKVVLLERSAGLDMHISTYKHERAVKRMRAEIGRAHV